MLFKGTPKRSAREISQAVEGIGGYLNAFTSEETTCYHARAGFNRFDEVLDVLIEADECDAADRLRGALADARLL